MIKRYIKAILEYQLPTPKGMLELLVRLPMQALKEKITRPFRKKTPEEDLNHPEERGPQTAQGDGQEEPEIAPAYESIDAWNTLEEPVNYDEEADDEEKGQVQDQDDGDSLFDDLIEERSLKTKPKDNYEDSPLAKRRAVTTPENNAVLALDEEVLGASNPKSRSEEGDHEKETHYYRRKKGSHIIRDIDY